MTDEKEAATEVKKLIRVNVALWEEMGKLTKLYRTSRTDAINRAMAYMLEGKFIPGFKKIEDSNATQS